jgi:hypothetical protein
MEFNLPLPSVGPVTGNNLSASQFQAFSSLLPSVGAGTSDSGFQALLDEILSKGVLEGAEENGIDKLGQLLGNIGSGVNIAGGIGQLILGFQANKLAKQGLNFQREAYRNNLNDTRTAFNKALTDQATTRDFVQGTNNAAEYIKKFQLGNGN